MKYKNSRLLILSMFSVIGISVLLCGGREQALADKQSAKVKEYAVQANTQEEKIYSIGSVSKVYVTTAVMQLVEEGKVELDTPITKYIPEFKMADERYKEITVRMLMNHTSGIMGTSRTNMILYDDNDMSNHDRLLASLEGQRLKTEPGAYAAYCNDGFGLLELIVEKVSGMSYTDYLEMYVADKIGAEKTGTSVNRFRMDNIVPIYRFGNIEYDYDYAMALGSGGVYATASEVAEFGSTFFKGNNTLLTEDSKNEMATRWAEDAYMDDSGLGWDYTEHLQYEDAGVKVLGKGGDIINQHAYLLIAPDNEISVSVLSSGGSSMCDELMAQALMNVALEEKGINIKKVENETVETVSEISKEYAKYQGYFATSSEVWNISFPDMKYMRIEKISIDNTKKEDYMLTTDGRFVRMEDDLSEWAAAGYSENQDLRQHYSQEILTFTEDENGMERIKKDEIIRLNGLGSYANKTYAAERLVEKPVSEEIQEVWERRSELDIGLYNDKYSSTVYDNPFAEMKLIKNVPGYILVRISGVEKLLEITGRDTAETFLTIPSSETRDVFDLKIEEGVYENGDSFEEIRLSSGEKYKMFEGHSELTTDVTEISLHSEEASWYHIGNDMASKAITVERPEESAVYVYNKYGEMVYSTHMQDWTEDIPLPKDGYIVFLGEDKGVVKITS